MDHFNLPLLLILLIAAPSDASLQRTLVLEMANILLDNYCYPESLTGMQEAIQQAISSGEILQISDKKTLASVLTAGVQGALNDPRITISYEPNYVPIAPPILPSLPREQLIRLVRNSVKLDIFDNNVGYLRMDRIIGESTAAKLGSLLKDNIWNTIARASSLILDLRYSTAGDMSGVPFIISFFSEPAPRIHIDTIYDRPSNSTTELWTEPVIKSERFGKDKDLIILTSKRTTGAAEAVAFTLKQLQRAVVVGERTAGGSVKVRKIRIARLEFYITVPVARFLSPNLGQGWEVSGVPPTLNIPAKEAVSKARSVLAVRRIIPHVLRFISDKIQRFYAFTDRVAAILQHLQLMDMFSVVSEEDVTSTINQELQTLTEDPRLIVKLLKPNPSHVDDEQVSYKVPNDQKLLEEMADSTFKVEVLPGNIGYLRFDKFLRWPARSKLDELLAKKVWEPLKDTDHLIIDLRFNTGGPSSSLAVLLSYLHDASPKRTFYTSFDRIRNTTTEHGSVTRITGPVYGSNRGIYVLTSYFTARTGEEFAYLMQSLHRGTVIGEITSGNLKHSATFNIEGTNFAITVPYINFLDNNGEFWLGGGVVPDAIVLADEAVQQAREIADFQSGIRFIIKGAGQILEEHYAIHDMALNVSKVLLNKWAEGYYRSVVDVESLTSQLTTDLQESSGDHRLHVFHCEVEPDKLYEEPQIPPVDEAEYFISSLFKVDVLPGNVGYLRFDMMADVMVFKAVGLQLVKLVWLKVVNTDSLIIDMRYNTGGFSTAVPLLCTYFFDPGHSQRLYTVYDHTSRNTTEVKVYPDVIGPRYGSTKDVYILTSHMTGSAAELFTQTMKDLKRATVVGEPTNGGSLSSDTYQIQDSDIYVSVPNQVVLSAITGTMWSLTGVEPDVNSQVSNALNVAKRMIAAKKLQKAEAK